ncbi:MAG: ribonuclease III [Bacteroidetes bacterium]|nr:ribonuclease III [Bacteroidota bacterium]MBU1717481.1 ribonuclease III [Bacteroidota bacterium]
MSLLAKVSQSVYSKEKEFIQALKNIIGVTPDNVFLYRLAFRHRSAAQDVNGMRSSNERLEYLGDAILGAIIAEYLFKKFPYKDEGFLTEMRSKIVSRENLNKLSRKLGLDQFIEARIEHSSLNKSAGGDTFEALIGAIYLDKGYNASRKFIIKRIIGCHLDIEDIEKTEQNYKSRLIEWSQKEKIQLEFRVVSEVETINGKIYEIGVFVNEEIKGAGKDFSKKKAEQRASEIACTELHIPID